MANLLTDVLSNVPVIGGLFDSGNDPIYKNRPQALQSVLNKYQTNDFSAYTPDQVGALQNIDLERANRGQMPLPAQDSYIALESIKQNRPIVPAPKRRPSNLLGNALSDIKDIALSIPRMPVALVHEAQALTDIGGEMEKIKAQPGGNALSDILQAPGIRMLPGAYTASHLAKGDFGELITHPVMTTLDILPYAEKAGFFDFVAKQPAVSAVKNYVRDYMYSTSPGNVLYQLAHADKGSLRGMQAAPVALDLAHTDPAAFKAAFPNLTNEIDIEQKLNAIWDRPDFKPILEDKAHLAQITQDAVEGRFATLSPIEKDLVTELEAWNTYTSYIIQKTSGDLVLVPRVGSDANLLFNKNLNSAKYGDFEVFYNPENGWYSLRGDLNPEDVADAARKAFQQGGMPALEIYRPEQAKNITNIMHTYTRGRLMKTAADLNEDITINYSGTGRRTGISSTPRKVTNAEIQSAWQQTESWFQDFSKYAKISGKRMTQMEESYKGYLLAAAKNGADISPFFKKANPAYGWDLTQLNPARVKKFIDSLPQNASPSLIWQDPANMVKYLDGLNSGKSVVIQNAIDKINALAPYMNRGDAGILYKEALDAVDRVGGMNAVKSNPAVKQMVTDIKRSLYYKREYANWRNSDVFRAAAKFDPKAKMAQTQKLINKQMPARYTDYLQSVLRHRVLDSYNEIQKATNVFTPEEMDKVAEFAMNGTWSSLQAMDSIFRDRGVTTYGLNAAGVDLPFVPKDLSKTAGDYTLSLGRIKDSFRQDLWDALDQIRNSGEPVAFVHHVSPSSAMGMNMRRILEYKPTPTQFKERVVDVSPWVPDVQIAANHRALELLHNAYYDEVFNRLVDPNGTLAQKVLDNQATYGKSYSSADLELDSPVARTYKQLVQEYEPHVRQLYDNGRFAPQLSYDAALREYIAKRYVQWNPESIVTWKSARFAPGKTADVKIINGQPVLINYPDIYVPKPWMKAIQEMSKQYEVSKIWDPVMNTFRMAVLPFSPRFHVNNILGGAMMGMMDAGPANWFSSLFSAREFLKTGQLQDPVSRTLIRVTPELKMSLGQNAKFVTEFQVARGQGIANKLLEHFGLDKQVLADVQGNLDKVRAGFDKAVDFSYKFNQITDDLYRATAYINEYRKIAKELRAQGVDVDTAHELIGNQAISAVRRVMHSWDQMAPIERTVIRNIIPFYGFQSHMIRFAFKFPYDHPFRAATIASFTRAELDDMQLIPDKFLAMIPLPFFHGKNGTEKFLNLTGANPFSDAADLFTLQGFAGTVNPLITTIGQQLGINFLTGGPDQSPLTGWDPITGRQSYEPPSLAQRLLTNIIPQANIPLALTGANQQFNSIAQTDPAAAKSFLLSSIGMPSIAKDVNLNEEAIKESYYRGMAKDQALSDALKSGTYLNAVREYPAFKPLLNQIANLQDQGRLNAFTPDVITAQQSLVAALTQPYASAPEVGPQNLQEAALARAGR